MVLVPTRSDGMRREQKFLGSFNVFLVCRWLSPRSEFILTLNCYKLLDILIILSCYTLLCDGSKHTSTTGCIDQDRNSILFVKSDVLY
jgi:hypothetical protein